MPQCNLPVLVVAAQATILMNASCKVQHACLHAGSVATGQVASAAALHYRLAHMLCSSSQQGIAEGTDWKRLRDMQVLILPG